jgi:3-hydroxyacyl-CoA dehydrogenase
MGGYEVPISVERRGAIAIVQIDNPPVNAIGHAERVGLIDAVATLAADPQISAVVLTGNDKFFAAGADAREFDAPITVPYLPDVTDAISQSPKPWIAALRGAALGGGLEIALACDARIVAPRVSLGLPEVTLGIVPGSGGTQRLPRLVGFKEAVTMISDGKPIDAAKAVAIGLANEVADDALGRAIEIAQSGKLTKNRLDLLPPPSGDEALAADIRAKTAKRAGGNPAPAAAIDLVELATRSDFAEGTMQERQKFLDLRGSSEAKALRHVFFAERGAGPSKDLQSIKPRPIDRIAVVGGGTMGTGIGYALLMAGCDVVLIEVDAAAAARADERVRKLIDDGLRRGSVTAEVGAGMNGHFRSQAGYDGLADRDLVIEAAFEDMDAKRVIFSTLDKAAPNALLATNTSYLDVNEIARSVSRPKDVVGLHFFAPAYLMKLLEIVQADETSPEALATGFALAKRLKKTPVLAKVCDGFIGNRILARYREAADMMLLLGAAPWDVDEAMVEFGYPMGPYEAQDLSGLDIAYANRKRKAATRDPNRRYVTIADRMVEEGRIGKKGSVGWYRYPGGGGAVVDPLVEDLIAEESHRAKVNRRDFTHEEIRHRLLTAAIDEGARILDEGVALSPADIDLVTVQGYAFPRWRGGLMHYAAERGFATIVKDLERFAADDPHIWAASAALKSMA